MSVIIKRKHSIEVNDEQAEILEKIFNLVENNVEEFDADVETIRDDFDEHFSNQQTLLERQLTMANFPKQFVDDLVKDWADAVTFDVEINIDNNSDYANNILSTDRKIATIEEIHYGN